VFTLLLTVFVEIYGLDTRAIMTDTTLVDGKTAKQMKDANGDPERKTV
jgi:hypothetical protein